MKTEYRIVKRWLPAAHEEFVAIDCFVVQKRMEYMGGFWGTVLKWTAWKDEERYCMPLSFGTLEEAQEWINKSAAFYQKINMPDRPAA